MTTSIFMAALNITIWSIAALISKGFDRLPAACVALMALTSLITELQLHACQGG